MDDPVAMFDLMSIILGMSLFTYCVLLIVGEDENS